MGEKGDEPAPSSLRTRADLSRTASFDDPNDLVDGRDPVVGHEFAPRSFSGEKLEARPYIKDEVKRRRVHREGSS